ncbi:tigger transposable element-derived protein 1 isoform X3 [Cherax quadricarinatus]|uniref:tigger transposable element-derived protein 1 isoform X3 n=1 Tax=Cherax quadricarinatus TaxID=27406 RepID=UPI00387EE055
MHVVTSPWKHLSCFVLFVQLFLPNFFFLTMGPKKVSAKNSAEKRKRMMSIHLKHEIIEKHERGVRVVDLARQYMRNTSTICTILKQKELLKAISPAMGIKIISKQRTSVHEEMEKLLLTWLTEKQLAGDTVAEGIICEMARGIYAELLQQTPGTSSDEALEKPFKASRGWLEKFKRRTGIHSVIRQGSQPSGQEEKKSPVVICLDLPDESCTIYKEISNVPENSQKKMRNEESMGGDVSETQKLDVSIKAKEGVWRSGRVRKRSSKLADFASTAEVDVLFRQYSDGPGSLHNDSNVSLI